MAKQWNKIFKRKGRVSTEIQEDLPKIVRLFKKKGIKNVLDLGCGSGRHLVYLAKNGFEVYGIDIADYGLKIAKDWLKKEGLKANIKIGSIYKRLPYEDNSFDAIVSTQTLHHEKIKNIRKLIKEIERILKPNGLIFITVRKRKFKKSWPAGKIIERHGYQKVRYKVIAPRTYIPVGGGEKNLKHYLFNKKILRKEFKNFRINDLWVESNKRHYCLLGELKYDKI
jgi:ubiquinone/menaquinone biosynthesis C-methylase UbiE